MEYRDYGPFPYVPITQRPKITWPNDAWLAVWVIPNVEFFPLTAGLSPHPPQPRGKAPSVRPWAQRDYGNRVGIWRMMDVFNKHGIRVSANLNSDICRYHPQIVEAGMEQGWEFLGHNKTNAAFITDIPPHEENKMIHDALAEIASLTGVRPKGWLGSGLAETWNTLDYLIDEGIEYIADWVNDDQPYLMDVDGRRICSIPYSYEINDSPFLYQRYGRTEDFADMIRRQFDVLYAEGEQSGRVMAICLHPWIIGVPHRIKWLDDALGYVAGHDKVWFATGGEIIDHYLKSGNTF